MSTPTDPAPADEPTTQPTKSPYRALLIGAGIALALMAVGIASLALGSKNNHSAESVPLESTTAKIGGPVPTFSLPPLTGTASVGVPITGGGNGKPAVLVFFASDCGPCQKEMPGLAAAVNAGYAKDAAVIGVAAQASGSEGALQAFVTKDHVTVPVGLDTTFAVTSGAFGFPAIPETVFVNSKGIITEIHFGATSAALLRQGVATLH